MLQVNSANFSSKSVVILRIVQFYIGIHIFCRRTYCPSCSSKSSLPKSRRFLFLRVAIQESAIWCCFESQITCGVNAICKVIFSTGRAFCACPYLMVGDPYVRCEGELGVPTVLVMIELMAREDTTGITWNIFMFC